MLVKSLLLCNLRKVRLGLEKEHIVKKENQSMVIQSGFTLNKWPRFLLALFHSLFKLAYDLILVFVIGQVLGWIKLLCFKINQPSRQYRFLYFHYEHQGISSYKYFCLECHFLESKVQFHHYLKSSICNIIFTLLFLSFSVVCVHTC